MDNEERDGRYEWHELNDQLAEIYRRMHDTARLLPELPADGMCVCRNQEWNVIQGGYTRWNRLVFGDEGKYWQSAWTAIIEGDEFLENGDGPEVVECHICREIYRRPDDITWN